MASTAMEKGPAVTACASISGAKPGSAVFRQSPKYRQSVILNVNQLFRLEIFNMGVRQTIVTAAVFVLSSPLLVSQARAPYTVTAVHHSSGSGLTRVAIEVSAQADFQGVRLHNPERFYIDILNSYPYLGGRASQSEELQDPMVNRIRVATFDAATTRVVLDLVSPAVLTSVTRLANPDRIVIE